MHTLMRLEQLDHEPLQMQWARSFPKPSRLKARPVCNGTNGLYSSDRVTASFVNVRFGPPSGSQPGHLTMSERPKADLETHSLTSTLRLILHFRAPCAGFRCRLFDEGVLAGSIGFYIVF